MPHIYISKNWGTAERGGRDAIPSLWQWSLRKLQSLQTFVRLSKIHSENWTRTGSFFGIGGCLFLELEGGCFSLNCASTRGFESLLQTKASVMETPPPNWEGSFPQCSDRLLVAILSWGNNKRTLGSSSKIECNLGTWVPDKAPVLEQPTLVAPTFIHLGIAPFKS